MRSIFIETFGLYFDHSNPTLFLGTLLLIRRINFNLIIFFRLLYFQCKWTNNWKSFSIICTSWFFIPIGVRVGFEVEAIRTVAFQNPAGATLRVAFGLPSGCLHMELGRQPEGNPKATRRQPEGLRLNELGRQAEGLRLHNLGGGLGTIITYCNI